MGDLSKSMQRHEIQSWVEFSTSAKNSNTHCVEISYFVNVAAHDRCSIFSTVQ